MGKTFVTPWFKERYGIRKEQFCKWFQVGDRAVTNYLIDHTRLRQATAFKMDAAFKALSKIREEYNKAHGDFRFEWATQHNEYCPCGESERIETMVLAKFQEYMSES